MCWVGCYLFFVFAGCCWLPLMPLVGSSSFFSPAAQGCDQAGVILRHLTQRGPVGHPGCRSYRGTQPPGVLVGKAPWIFGNQPNPEGTCALAKLSIWFRYPTPGVLVGQVS